MRRISIFFLSMILGLTQIPLISATQIAKIMPEKPQWGDTITVTYNPSAEAAEFLPGDDLYTVYSISRDDSMGQGWKKMQKSGNLLSCKILIEKGMSFLTFYFITKDKWDRKAIVSTMVYRKDGIPAMGANLHKMLTSSPNEYLEFFQKERELYPDNYAVFRDKWLLEGAFNQKNLLPIVKKDMAFLQKQVKKESPRLLFALSSGYMLLDDEPASRNILHQMVRKYPHHFYTSSAIRNYDYFVFSKQIKGDGPEEVNLLKLEFIKKAPQSNYARNNCAYFVALKEVELKTISSVCKPWIKKEPDNPLPYFNLAMACFERKQRLDQATTLINKAIDLVLHGKLRFYKDISGFLSEKYLPRFYKLSSEIYLQAGNTARALGDIKTAQALLKETQPEYYEVEANIWQKLGYLQKAEKVFFEAYGLGSLESKTSIKNIFQKRHESLEGFDTYFAEELAKNKSSEDKKKKAAPDFEVKTLEGKTLHLSDLKGKVVVLNFWFAGCAPCRVEIPGLNLLREKYQEKEVVFIAFALDKSTALTEFLQKIPFKYHVVAEAGKIATLYGVKVYPTHIIINQQGQIEYFLTGGSKTRHEQLQPLINNLLR